MRRFFTTNIYPNFKDILIFISLFILINIITALFFGKIFNHESTEKIPVDFTINDTLLSLSYVTSFVITIALCSVYRHLRSKKAMKIKTIIRRHNTVAPLYTLWALIMLAAASFSVEPVTKLFSESMDNMYDLMANMGSATLIVSVVVAPIVEEILFRGIIQSDLQQVYSPRFSILITSLIFAIVHINPAQAVSAFLLSTIIGYVYYKTESLWVVIFIHFFNNALAQTIFILYDDKESYLASVDSIFGSEALYYSTLAVSVSITGYVIAKVIRLNKVPQIKQKSKQ